MAQDIENLIGRMEEKYIPLMEPLIEK